MLSLDDRRWLEMNGGYKLPFDPRPLFVELEADANSSSAWDKIWNELHHQGDVGEASYASVPVLVRIYKARGGIEWKTYAFVATIELARTECDNPEVPEWLRNDYFGAIRELAELGTTEVMLCNDADTIRSMLAVIALAKGCRTHAEFLAKYSEDEMRAIKSGDWSPAGHS